MLAALNNVFNLKWEEKSPKDRYKHVQIVKTCTNMYKQKKELNSQCGRSSRSNWNINMLASVDQG